MKQAHDGTRDPRVNPVAGDVVDMMPNAAPHKWNRHVMSAYDIERGRFWENFTVLTGIDSSGLDKEECYFRCAC